MVFNRITGEMATREWMKTYLATGIPNPKRRTQLPNRGLLVFVLSLVWTCTRSAWLSKSMRGGEFREVRLFHFEDGMATTKPMFPPTVLLQDELEEDISGQISRFENMKDPAPACSRK